MEGNPVTVTVVGGDGRSEVKEIVLMGHCVLCLRRTSKRGGEDKVGLSNKAKRAKMGEQEEVVPEAVFLANCGSGFLWTLNWTWNALRRKRGHGGSGNEMEEVFGVSGGDTGANSNLSGVTKFQSIPTMCQDCVDKLMGLDKLHNEAMKEIGVIRDSLGTFNTLGDLRKKLYSSPMERRSVHDTLEFLEDFRNNAAQELNDTLPGSVSPVFVKTENDDDGERFSDNADDFQAPGGASMDDPLSEETPLPGTSTVSPFNANAKSLRRSTRTSRRNYPGSLTEPGNQDYFKTKEEESQYSAPESIDDEKDFIPEKESSKSKNVPGEQKVECKLCGIFVSRNYLKGHQQKKHQLPEGHTSVVQSDEKGKSLHLTVTNPETKTEYYICLSEQCRERFEGKDAYQLLERHLSQEHGRKTSRENEENVECPSCGKHFRTTDILKKHQKYNCTALERKKIRCDRCGNIFLPGNLPRHQRFCKGEDKTYKNVRTRCEQCGIELATCSVRTHFQIFHPELFTSYKKLSRKTEKIVECTDCGKRFRTFYNMQLHKKLYCAAVERQKVTCELCGSSVRPENLSKHQTFCKREKTYKSERTRCEHCGIEVASCSFRAHLKKYHPDLFTHNERQRLCELCKAKMPDSQLREHLKEHVGEEYILNCPNPDCKYVGVILHNLITVHLGYSKGKCSEWMSKNQPDFVKLARSCKECGQAFDQLSQLRAHLLRYHEAPEKNYPCPISGCQQRFSVKQSVVIHLIDHDDAPRQTSSQPCSGCGKKLVKVEEMEAHLKEEHGVLEVVKCRKCPFQFPTWEELVDHMYKHRRGELLCDICGDTGDKFNRHVDLQSHYFTVHQIGKQYQCEQCPRTFFKLLSLNNHVKTDHKKVQDEELRLKVKPTYQCADCGVVFKTEYGLKSHNIREHGAEPYGCKFCTETFITRDSLYEHLKDHKGVGKPRGMPCRECGQVLPNRQFLHSHRISKHLTPTHVCELCGKSYKFARKLKHHHETVHLGIRKWTCDTCGEGFTDAGTLKRHNLIHTGERPFACDICGQRFRHKEVLKTHVKGHLEKGDNFKPNGPMKEIRKRTRPC